MIGVRLDLLLHNGPSDLDGAHRPVHQQQMADEPRSGDQDAGEIERQSEDVPVGEISRGLGGELGCPPAIGKQNSSPPAGKQEENDSGEIKVGSGQ